MERDTKSLTRREKDYLVKETIFISFHCHDTDRDMILEKSGL